MAGVIDKILDWVQLSDSDEDDEDLYEEEIAEQIEKQNKEIEKEEERRRPARPSQPRRTREREREEEPAEEERPSGKVSFFSSRNNNSNVTQIRNAKGMEVCLIRPTTVEDAREISDTLLSGRAVVINLEGLHVELAQRIIDFTSGACYSISGNLQKISNYIFIVTPRNIELSGDFQEFLSTGAGMNISTLDLSL